MKASLSSWSATPTAEGFRFALVGREFVTASTVSVIRGLRTR